MKTDAAIEIKDPSLQKLMAATDRVSIVASGALKPGKYRFKNSQIEVSSNAKFDLDMSIDFDGKPIVSAASTNGVLTLTDAIKFDNIPLPTRVELKHGEATIEMDIARALFAVILNGLQQHHDDKGAGADLSDLPANVQVKEARVAIKPDSKLEFAGVTAVLGGDSFLLLENVSFSTKTEYKGSFCADLKLKEQSQFKSPFVTCGITSGKIQCQADIVCHEGKRTIEINKDTIGSCSVVASGCSLKATGDAGIQTDCDELGLTVNNMTLVDEAGSSELDLSLSGNASLKNTKFDLVSAPHSVKGAVPDTASGKFSYTISKGKSSIGLSVDKNVVARDFQWSAKIKETQFTVNLRKASIAHSAAESGSGITVNLDSAAIEPAKLHWKNPTTTLDVSLDQATRITSAGPLTFTFKNARVSTPSSIPFKLTAGNIDIRDSKKHVFKLKRVNGLCKVGVGDNIKLDSELSMNVSSHADTLGIPGFNARIGKLKINATEEHAQLQLIDCLVLLSMKELKDTIRNKLPDPYVKQVDETLLEKKQWRYRNFRIKKITVRNPNLSKFDFQKVNQVAVDADADLNLEGTVEVYHQKLNSLSKTPSSWKEHPWTADAHASRNRSGSI